MPQTCSVCRNPKRSEIDSALLHSEGLRKIAKRYGTSTTALHRHKNSCISAQLAKSKEVSEIASAAALVRELNEITRKTGAVLARAVREKDGELALKAIARLERQLELKGRLLGQLEKQPAGGPTTVHVVYVDKMLNVGAPDPNIPALPAPSE